MESLSKINSVRDIKDAIKAINKIYKNDRASHYDHLCSTVWNDSALFKDFFTMNPYDNHHIELAARLFTTVGVNVYSRILDIIPNSVGNVVTNWDEFMIAQVEKIRYIATHPYDSSASTLRQFFSSIQQVCDDDLMHEICTYVSRSDTYRLYGVDISSSQYPINADFLSRRFKTMGMNQNSMARYLHLVSVLAEFDYIAAFKAWGEFYYVFEEVYVKHQPTQRAFTFSFYNAFFTVPQRVERYNSANVTGQSNIESLCMSGKERIDQTIASYGWDVLHHMFEINADADEFNKKLVLGQSWVYERLSGIDKIKAENAVSAYKEHKAKHQAEGQASCTTDADDIAMVLQLLSEDMELGMSVWKNHLINLTHTERKVTNKAFVNSLDRTLLEISQQQKFHRITSILKHPSAPFLECECPQIYLAILDDIWMVDTYFSNCQQMGCATEVASLVYFQENMEQYRHILSLIRDNPRVKMDVTEFDSLCRERIRGILNDYFFDLGRAEMDIDGKQTFTGYNARLGREIVDVTAMPEMSSILCQLVFDHYSLEDAYKRAIELFRRASTSENESREWFLQRFDDFLEKISFDLFQSYDIVLGNILSIEIIYAYSANTSALTALLEKFVQYGRTEHFLFARDGIKQNSVLPSADKFDVSQKIDSHIHLNSHTRGVLS